jgi:photosystem II stability/assembly factor-like uncharacterized protein
VNGDRQLQETLKWLAGPVDRSGVWASIEAQAGDQKHSFAPRRGSGLRVAVFASIAVVLVAAITVGSLEAVKHLGKDQPVVVINDDTAGMAPGSTGQTTQTATSAEGTWLHLPLLAKGETIRTISISALVMDPSDPAILYATTSEGLFKSTDGAGSWGQLPTIAGDVGVPFLDPTSPSTVYLVCSIAQEAEEAVSDHLLRSDDGGMTWTDLTEAGVPRKSGDIWVATAFDTTTTPSTIYMWDDTGYVWRSTDRGSTWTRLSFDEGMQAFEQADNPRETPPIPAAAQEALDDFLAPLDDWVDLTDADTGAVVGANGAPLVDPDHLSTFYQATSDGVYKSFDSGRTWRKASTGLPDVTDPPDAAVSAILVDPSNPSTLYATTSAGIHRSTDGGTEWTLILEGEGATVALAPSTPARLYASGSAGLLRSDDGGTDWTRLNDPRGSDVCFSSLVLAIADQPDTVLALAEEIYWGPFHIYRSSDAGNSWQRTDLRAGFTETIPIMVEDPQHPSTIYLCGTTEDSAHHVFKSTDAGATWTDLDPEGWSAPVWSLAVDPYNPDTVWAVQDGGVDQSGTARSLIRRSTDGGATWEQVELAGLGVRTESTERLLFDPRLANTVYAVAGAPEGQTAIQRSTDGGTTWENIGENLPAPVFLLAPDPASEEGLYAATSGGLFKWVPNGE